MKNIAYAGSLVALLDIDMDDRGAAAGREVRGKKKRCANRITEALQLGYDYAQGAFDCPLPFHLEKMDANERQDSDRRQHRDRARLRLCRRDRGRLVSHHARRPR